MELFYFRRVNKSLFMSSDSAWTLIFSYEVAFVEICML